MIVRPDDWQAIWDVIEDEFTQSTEKSVSVVFSVHEVETVCAIKMLQIGLGARGIQFSSYPVEDYTQLREILHKFLNGSDELRTVFFINCGAGAFVKDLAPRNASNVRYVVVDSHRPVCPKYNDSADADCMLFLAPDDPQQLEEIPLRNELDDMTEEDRAFLREEVVQEDQQEDSDNDGSPSPAKRRKLNEQQDQPSSRERWRQLREREREIRDYLDMGSSYGKPTPLVLQPLAEALSGALKNDILWAACVGLTDQWVHQRISSQHYDTWYRQLKDTVGSNDDNQRYANQANNNGQVPSSTPVIAAERDYKLFLPRHWTLFDSFIFSNYVAPRLQTWRRSGEDSVGLVLANMGISIQQAQTQWGSMHRSNHVRFKEGLQKAVESSNLVYTELATEGFVLHHDRQIHAASDVVHAVTALLSEHALQEVQGDDRQTSAAFWDAVKAVSVEGKSGFDKLQEGINKAKLMQQAIIKDGGLLTVDRKMVFNTLSHIAEMLLHMSPPTNAREFRHPLTLLRLAHFVKDATRFARKATQARTPNYPILVVGPEDSQGYCLAIGLRAALLPNKPQYNLFGRTFKEVLETIGHDFRWDTNREPFDSAVLYVHKDSVKNFVLEVRKILKNAAIAAQQATQQTQQQNTQQQQPQQQASGREAKSDDSGEDESSAEESEDAADGSELAATDAEDDDGANMAHVDVVAASDDEEQQEAGETLEDEF